MTYFRNQKGRRSKIPRNRSLNTVQKMIREIENFTWSGNEASKSKFVWKFGAVIFICSTTPGTKTVINFFTNRVLQRHHKLPISPSFLHSNLYSSKRIQVIQKYQNLSWYRLPVIPLRRNLSEKYIHTWSLHYITEKKYYFLKPLSYALFVYGSTLHQAKCQSPKHHYNLSIHCTLKTKTSKKNNFCPNTLSNQKVFK